MRHKKKPGEADFEVHTGGGRKPTDQFMRWKKSTKAERSQTIQEENPGQEDPEGKLNKILEGKPLGSTECNSGVAA